MGGWLVVYPDGEVIKIMANGSQANNKVELDVYVTDHCWACEETRRIVADIAPQYPGVAIELRDLTDARKPGSVFATPTYVLDGRTIYLGNPTREELKEKLEAAQRSHAGDLNSSANS